MDVEWRELEHQGSVVGRYQVYRSDPPTADLFEALADVPRVVEAITARLAGWWVATADGTLADALVKAGGVQKRHSHVMTLRLPSPEGQEWSLPWRLEPLTPTSQVGEEVVPLVRAAYPPGHPDEEEGTDAEIVADIHDRLTGGRLGPLLPGSALAWDGDRPVGLVLVNDLPGAPPAGGPWVSDVCRDPDPRYRGMGRALLQQAIARTQESDAAGLSLAVTVGNSAQRVYEDLGFTIAVTSRKVSVPG